MKEYRTRADGTIVEYNEADLAEEKRKVEASNKAFFKGCLTVFGVLFLLMGFADAWWIALPITILIVIVWICKKCGPLLVEDEKEEADSELPSSSRPREKRLSPSPKTKRQKKPTKRSAPKKQSEPMSSSRKRRSS